MPVYQIHRLKDVPRQQFRWAPHTPGVTIVKPKDYERRSVMEAATPYALWLALKEGDDALGVGDLIEVVTEAASSAAVGGMAPGDSVSGATAALAPAELRILKYIGFEEARWYLPEPAPSAMPEPVAVT